MSNKFWAAGSDSESESSASDSSSSDDEKPMGGRTTGRFQMSDSSSDSDDDVRVVKSAKDRVIDALRECVIKVNNGLKNMDWAIIEDEFANTNKKLDKSKNQLVNGTPKFYVKMLAAVEDSVAEVVKDKPKFKALKPAIQRIVNRMKLNVKKHNKNFESDIEDFRTRPDAYDTEEEADSDSDDDDSDSDSDSDADEAADSDSDDDDDMMKKPKAKTGGMDDDDSLSDDSMFKDNDLSDDSDSDDDDDMFTPPAAATAAKGDGRVLAGRARWLKKPESEKKRKAKEVKAAVPRKQGDGKVAVVTKRVQVVERPLTEDEVNVRIADVVASRGRKGTDPRELLRKLEVLSRQARRHGPRLEVPVVMHLISVMYDSHRVIDDYMDLSSWRTAFRYLMRVVALLNADKGLTLGMLPTEDVATSAATSGLMKKDSEEGAAEGAAAATGDNSSSSSSNENVILVVGTLETFLSRLEGEYTKSLQQINPHSKEYLVRLADEASLIELSALIFEYYKRAREMGAASNVALVHVEHIYYKHSTVDEAVHKAHAFNKKWGHLADVHPSCTSKMTAVPSGEWDSSKTHPAGYMGYPTVSVEVPDAAVALNEMCQFIFKNGDERTKTRALLCSVFHHALHDRFYKARDLFLISHIQDGIDKADTKTQILFNRVLAALGLSAFRAGLVLKAYDCLSGICSGRPLMVKELLAQGQSRWPDKDPEQERIERRRQMPYHMHINHDLLDCCYLTCAMLTELPGIARGAGYGPQAYNRPFKKYFQSYNRQVFTGPPENTREHVMAASKALLAGDWKQGTDLILDMDVWNLIPNEGGDAVKKMLSTRIKEEAVRTYLLSSVVSAYSSIDMEHLCEWFEMEAATVRRIVSKTIFSKELNAAWDGDTLMILKSETSTLQQLSVRVSDKVNQLADSNERLLDPLNGGNMFRKDEWQDNRGGNYRGKGQWQDNRGGNNQQGGNRWAKSGATGRGNYNDHRNNNNHQGGRNNNRGGGHHRHNNHNQDNNRREHHRGDGQQQQGGGRGGGGFNDRSNESEKPKMAWNAVSSAA